MKKSSDTDPAVYVWSDIAVQERPFKDKTLVAIAAELLCNRAMTATELVVAMMERGYETKMTRKAMLDALRTAMRRDDRFKKDGEKWSNRENRGTLE